MFTFLLVVQAIIAASLVGVILMQRSEGGGLGMGGSPSGLMSARGAADFLTRATAVLATLFVVMSIALAALASVSRGSSRIDTSLARPEAQPMAPVGAPNPLGAIPGPGLGGAPGVPAPAALPTVAPEPIAPAPVAALPLPTARRTSEPETPAPSASGRHAKRSDGQAAGAAGSGQSSTTPTPGESGRSAKVRTPALESVPLRQSPKVGTLAPAEPATAAPSSPSPTPVATSSVSGAGASGAASEKSTTPPAATPPGNSAGQ